MIDKIKIVRRVDGDGVYDPDVGIQGGKSFTVIGLISRASVKSDIAFGVDPSDKDTVSKIQVPGGVKDRADWKVYLRIHGDPIAGVPWGSRSSNSGNDVGKGVNFANPGIGWIGDVQVPGGIEGNTVCDAATKFR
ncbi:MAG: hypothetical protein ABSB86_11670 [Bryobacteraceae bacterium]